jgi:hypothetical protein
MSGSSPITAGSRNVLNLMEEILEALSPTVALFASRADNR